MTEATSQPSQAAEPAAPAPGEELAATPAANPDPATTASGEKLDRQTRNWRALERDRDHWREMAMRQAPQAAAPAESKPEPPSEKTLADFDFDQGRYAAYVREQAREEARAAAREEVSKSRQAEMAQSRDAAFGRRIQEFYKANPAAEAAIRNPDFTQSEALLDELKDSENPGAVALYLAQHLDEAEWINSLEGRDLTRAFARIEAKVDAPKGAAPSNALRTATPPPAPAPKVNEATPGLEKSDSDKSDDEWFASRKRKQAAKK